MFALLIYSMSQVDRLWRQIHREIAVCSRVAKISMLLLWLAAVLQPQNTVTPQYIQKLERKVAFKNAVDKQKAEKQYRKKCGKEKTTKTHKSSDGVPLLMLIKNICLHSTYLFGHPIRTGVVQKRVHEGCCTKLFQLHRNTALVAQVAMNHFFVKCQGDSLKEQRQ